MTTTTRLHYPARLRARVIIVGATVFRCRNSEARLNEALASSSLPALLSEVSPGQLCLAPSSLDDKYYRAMVVGCEGNEVR